MIILNIGAGALVVGFLLRKTLTHPDVIVQPMERGFGEYTPKMAEESTSFREFPNLYVPFVQRCYHFVLKNMLQIKEVNPITMVTNVTKPLPPPLEYTGYFDDGLYSNVTPTAAPSGFYNDVRNYREGEEE